MADSKITALTAISTVDPTADPLVIVDVSDTSMAASGTTKKSTINQLLGAGGTATLASATITGDLTVRTNKLFVNATGVGVGTTSLFGDLNIQNGSNCRFEVTSQAGGTTIENLNNARNAYLNMTMFADAYIWNRLGSEAMRLNSTGLGVGTTVQYARLTVAGTNSTGIANIQNSPFASNTLGSLSCYIGHDGTANRPFIQAASGNAGIAFDLLIQPYGGNVGIGVAPSAGKGCLQLVSGINFPATQVASSDANTLDDYEEGSFVPTLNSGTFSSASCRYTKIGNMVTIFFDVTVGTGGGDRITNLPFAAASTSTVASGIYTNNQTYAAGTTAPVVVVGGSSSTLFFRTVGTGVAFSAMTLTAAANLTGSISYFV